MERSPFRRDHAASARFFERSSNQTRRTHVPLLFGERDFGWPLLALRTRYALGPVRHALAQRVVAGTMTVFPPISLKPAPKDSLVDPGDDTP